MMKVLAAIVSIVIGLFMVLAFQGVVDFLTQVAKIELGENSLIIIVIKMGFIISILFGIYIGKKVYALLSTKPNFDSPKKTIIKIVTILLITITLSVVSITSVTVYLSLLNLPSDIYASMLTNMTVKLLVLSLVFSLIINSKIFSKRTKKIKEQL